MVENVKLFINNREVDFQSDPKILFNYQVTDTTNPTVVRNSFSKTLTLDGTPTNNDIFGHYWDVERYLLNGGQGGVFFNSSKKAPFQLFVGSDLYEDGYVKLDNIKRNGEQIQYQCTLYGGLGDFFFNLSTTDNGDQKKLSDLVYTPSGDTDEFNFVANINSIYTAWRVLRGQLNPNMQQYRKWAHINFMPAYNGVPSDFDADKVLINVSGTTLPYSSQNADDKNWYQVKSRQWTIGTLPQDMTEWEIRDLRSYLQRPVIKMSSVIEACCDPSNNGGYTVNLDSDFFNNDNPYWTKTWLTLPMIQSLEYSNSQQVLTGATLTALTTTGEVDGLMYQDLDFTLGDFPDSLNSITVKGKINYSNGFSLSSFVWFWNYNGDDYHTGWWCLGSLFCQLIAVNGDTVVGASEVYNLTTPVRHNGGLWYGHNGHYPESSGIDSSTGRRKMGGGSQYVPYMDMPIYSVLGRFGTSGFRREISHTDNSSTYDSDPYEFTFNINNIGSPITGLRMVYYWGATADKMKHFNQTYMFRETYCNAWITLEYTAQGNNNVSAITLADDFQHNLYAVMGESLGRTGTQVTKQLLLNTESSPCDYLLSYAKMFGLHFTKDIGSNTINIMTRKTFYNRTDVVDLEDYIDHSKDVSITPLLFSSKWYQFLQEKDETEYQSRYLTTKGVEYGSKVLDTGYEFSAEKKNLLDKNAIKAGIEGLEKSKWFSAYNNDDSLRPWMRLGLKYTMWYGENEMEYSPNNGNSGTLLPLNEGEGMKYYDVFPKLQFHSDDNDPTEGTDCLVFYSGFKSVTSGRANPLTYLLSDDSAYQTDLNDGTPCWLFTKYEYVGDDRICYKLDRIPVFERYLTNADSGVITKSLDFGSAQELYIPNYSLTDDTNIYHNFWRTYLTDLFDVNTKQMTCYVKIDDNPGVNWLRRFYWFNNSLWRVNKITDWNPASFATTKVEFIKVQDIANYTTVSQTTANTISLSADTYLVDATGGTVTLSIDTDNGAFWRLFRYGDITNPGTTAGTGTGSATRTVTFTANTHDYRVTDYFRVVRADNNMNAVIGITQRYPGEQSLTAYPEDVVVPASGGTVEITFTWYNQGGSYVDYVDYNEGSEYLQFTADTSTKRLENKAILTFGANTGNTVLHNYCTFYSYTSDENYSIGIDQLPAGYAFNGGGATVNVPVVYATGATFSNVPYWITIVNNLDGTYDLIANENLYESGRTDYVTLELEGSSAEFYVSQGIVDVFTVERTGGTGSIISSGGNVTLLVSSTTNWSATSMSNWCTITPTGGTTSGTVTATLGLNEDESRVATIVFTNAIGSVINYNITQNGINDDLFVDPTALLFPGSGGTDSFNVNNGNDTWAIVAKPSWVSVSQPSTTSITPTTVYVTAETNTTDESRVGSIVVFNITKNKPYVVTISQESGEVPFSVERVGGSGDVLVTGGTIQLKVTSSTAWTGTSNVAWAVLSSSSASTSATITVTFAANDDEARQAVFSFVDAHGNTATYQQTQAGEGGSNKVNPSMIIYDATGGTSAVTVNISNTWQIVGQPSWVTYSPSSGSTSGMTVNITAIPYSGAAQRQGTVVFFDTVTTKTYLVYVMQNPASGEILAINPSSIQFEASGGTAQLVIISNTDWTIG